MKNYHNSLPGLEEPFQAQEFDEIAYVVTGTKLIEVYSRKITPCKAESIFIERDTRVRYSNQFNEPV